MRDEGSPHAWPKALVHRSVESWRVQLRTCLWHEPWGTCLTTLRLPVHEGLKRKDARERGHLREGGIHSNYLFVFFFFLLLLPLGPPILLPFSFLVAPAISWCVCRNSRTSLYLLSGTWNTDRKNSFLFSFVDAMTKRMCLKNGLHRCPTTNGQ